MKRETVEIQKALFSPKTTKLQKYCDLIVGRRSWRALLGYEVVTLASANVPGALGLWLRSKLYPLLLKRCGRQVTFGQDVVMRHPHKIEIGDNVVIDDHAVLDAKGTDNDGIRIGSGVFLGRNSILSCKNGDIVLEDEVNVGFNCEIFSASRVTVGARSLLAAYTYLIGGDHEFASVDVAVLEQGRVSRGITVGAGAWLGAGVKVLDGVSIGAHAIVGTGAVVTADVADYAIAVGLPARAVRDRRDASTPASG